MDRHHVALAVLRRDGPEPDEGAVFPRRALLEGEVPALGPAGGVGSGIGGQMAVPGGDAVAALGFHVMTGRQGR